LLPRLRGTFFSKQARPFWLAGIVLILSPIALNAEPKTSSIVCREELSIARRELLASKLRKITGLAELRFDGNGVLRAGTSVSAQGSETARELLAGAIYGRNVVVIEDASHQSSVAFARVVPGRWKKNGVNSPSVFVIQIDFADFEQLVGDERAREAFNAGWAFLHELDHVVSDSADATSPGEAGECEAHINQMRRECDLPERADYFSVLSPLATDNTFMTRLVRLAFEASKPATSEKKRYWLTWDANAVGGLELSQIAAAR
jgi:hypothetical protein